MPPHIIQAYRNAEVLSKIQHDATGLREAIMEGKGTDLSGQSQGVIGITQREAEVLYWVAQGKTNMEIAIILSISPRTVKKHLEHIYEKLSVENRTAAEWIFWYKNGQKHAQGTFYADKQNGRWIEWNEEGKKRVRRYGIGGTGMDM